MSSSNYRLNLIWASHGEQLRADLNALQSKLSGVTTEAGRGQRQMGLWGQQMKAIGTTIRYAFAGALIYGIATAISSLGDFEAKMGEIDALAANMKDGNLVGLGGALEDLGDHALSLSNKWGIAVGDIQDQMRAFYSSGFGNTSVGQAKGWTDVLAQMQLITEGADPAKMAVGVAGLTQATGGAANPTEAAKKIRDIIAVTLRRSTAFRGEDIARDIGRLSGAGPALRMTPEQIFAIYGTAGKVGGSGAVIGRGVAQLLTASLANPKTKQQKEAFGQLGLPTDPDALRQMGGYAVLMKLLQSVGPVRGPARSALGNADLTDEEALGMPGMPKGKISLLYKAIGRMESVRQILSIASVGGASEVQKFLKALQDGEKQHRGEQQARLVNERRWYQQMNEAQKNARLSIMRGFEFALKPLSGVIKSFSDFTIHHQRATTIALGGAAASGLFLKFFAGSSLGAAVLSRIPGFSKLGVQKAGQLGAAAAIGSGLAAFDSQGTGRRSDPLWVIIDPLSWFFPGAPSGTAVGPGNKNTPPGGSGIFNKIRSRGGKPFPIAGAGVATLGLAEIGMLLFGTSGDSGYKAGQNEWEKVYQQHPALRNMIKAVMQFKYKGRDPHTIPPSWFKAFGAMGEPGTHGFDPSKAFDILSAQDRANRRQATATKVSGEAKVTVVLEPADALKRTVKGQKLGAVKVPLGTGNPPQHRGKKGAQVGAASGATVK